MAYVIGADVGSQSVKALLMDMDGAEVSSASVACTTYYPAPGWAEQDPQDWLAALCRAVRSTVARSGVAARDVKALALGCQVDGLVAMDADLAALRRAIVWLDRRATSQCDALREAAGDGPLVSRTGLNADASHTAPKAMWLRDEEPETYARTRWLAPVGGYLTGWLTGDVVQDYANASSTLLYDLSARAWSQELIAHAELDTKKLPPIAAAADVIGPLRSSAADALGLTTDCVVAVGTGDDHAAAVGAGAVTPRVVVDITGTAEPVVVPAHQAVFDECRIVETHAHAIDGMLLVENPGFVSGGSTQWLAALHGITQTDVFAHAGEAPPGAGGALFLPTLSGSTTPRWNDRMRGVFAGLALSHDITHLSRAVLEGCAYALRDVVERFAALGLDGGEVRVVGGGARSHTWLQIKADITGRPMRPLQGAAATSRGAAMLAAIAAGIFRNPEEAAAQCVHLTEDPVLPRAEFASVYADGYARYRRLFDEVEGALA
ncbi:MAG TPA: FGGY family carbohydrate kinase [Gaiellaceae bacterium]